MKRGEAPVLGVLTAVRSPDTLAFPKSYHSVGERELLLFLKLGDGYTGDRYVFQTLCTNYMFFPSLRNSQYIYLFK